MTVIPGQQDVATFMGGNYSQPQMTAPQIPGTPNLPQVYNPTNYAPQSLNSPQANPFNSALLNAIKSGTQNSGSNHVISAGNYGNNTGASPMGASQGIFSGIM